MIVRVSLSEIKIDVPYRNVHDGRIVKRTENLYGTSYVFKERGRSEQQIYQYSTVSVWTEFNDKVWVRDNGSDFTISGMA